MAKHRLNSWKEVAAFFGRTERTVMRWELTRGLPIHRLPGESRSRIYAEPDELEAWMQGALPRPEIADDVQSFFSTRWLGAGLALALIAAGLGADAPAPPRRPPPAAVALYKKGMQDWVKRTPDSLVQAVDEFNDALRLDPHYAAPYAGLAITYDLLREYTAMPEADAYQRAKDYAQKAIALDEHSALGHAALAFALYHGFGDADAAIRDYKRALALAPHDGDIRHWYATFLLARGDYQGALRHINLALELDPQSRAIQADRALIMARAGQPDEAIFILQRLTQSDPDFRSPHAYLSQIYFSVKPDDTAYVRETMISERMAGDLYGETLAKAAEDGLRKGGHTGMLKALLAAHIVQLRQGVGSAMSVAEIYAKLGDDTNATTYFTMAIDRKEEDARDFSQWPQARRLMANRAFRTQTLRLAKGN